VADERKRRLGHGFFRIVRNRKNHEADFEVVFPGELVVAFVVSGDAHNRAGAIIHKDVVRHPDRNFFAVEGIDGVAAGGHAVFFNFADVADLFSFALLGDELIDLGAQIWIGRGEIGDDGMLGRELHRGCAEDGIDARGEDTDGCASRAEAAVILRVIEFEIDQGTFAPADPVALHSANFFGPAAELIEITQQFVGVLGDAEEPLLELALLDQRILVTPTAAVDDLFVGKHGAALRAPVDSAFLAIRQSFFVELKKEPLVPAVVVGQAGSDFAGPVVGEAEALHLHLHFGDVAERPLARRRVVLDGRIFRRQAEGIPSHGMKDVVAVHPHIAGEGVTDGVVAHMAHVQDAGGIGQHFEDVVFLLGSVGLGGVELGIVLPALEPFGFHALRIVAVVVGPIGVFGAAIVGRRGDFRVVWRRHKKIRRTSG